MYKKAGIVVGVLMIALAITIFFIVKNANSKKGEGTSQSGTTQQSVPVVQPSSQVTAPPEQNPAVSIPVQESPIVSISVQEPPVTSIPSDEPSTPSNETSVPEPVIDPNTKNLIILDPNKLPQYVDDTDIGTVVSRNIYAYNNQVLYSLVVNTTVHGQIEYFCTFNNYYQIADGTRLNCTLRTFSTAQGGYPSIVGIELVR